MTVSLDRNLGWNLWPIQGRDAELVLAGRLLTERDVRLLTLTGPGGVGKTRLAVELVRRMRAHFAGGVHVIDLTRATASADVPALIAQSLGLIARHSEPPLAAVLEDLHNRELLLLLDNCEHLTDLAALLADLIAESAGLTVLATSRSPIGLSWEHRLTIMPLALPDARQTDPDQIGLAPSVSVFVARAQATDPTFELTDQNARDVAQLVERLDGLPLALELAAARIGLLAPGQMVARLDRHLPLLAVASLDRPGRHRSLQAAMDWSYELLDDGTRRLFRTCSVFAGSFSLGAAEEVATGSVEGEVLAGLAVLVDENLIHRVEDADEPRFAMLQTIREYAGELLRNASEEEHIAERHAHYFADMAMRAGPQLITPSQEEWLRRLRTDRGNLQLSLEWLLKHDPVAVGRTASSVARMWWMDGQVREGYEWLERALTASEDAAATDRLAMLWGAGELALWLGDVESGRHWHREQLILAQRAGDHESVRWARLNLSVVSALSGELDSARREMRKLLDEVTGDDQAWLRTLAYRNYGWFSGLAGDTATAHRADRAAAAGFRRFGCVRDLAVVEISQADFAQDAGRHDEAIALTRRSLQAGAQLNDRRIIGFAADVICTVVANRGEALVRLLAAANSATAIAGMPIDARRNETRQTLAADLSAVLGETAFAAAWCEGSTLAPAEVVATALSLLDADVGTSASGSAVSTLTRDVSVLTARESEVLTLVAEGMPNKRIARTLGIAERTVKAHLTTAFQKLGAYSRGHAALVARERGLIRPRPSAD